jgi:hypothetical protein
MVQFAEFCINDRGIWPLEVAPRPIGGRAPRRFFVPLENPTAHRPEG